MSRPRKRHTAEFKARVALEAVRGLKTTAQPVNLGGREVTKWPDTDKHSKTEQ